LSQKQDPRPANTNSGTGLLASHLEKARICIVEDDRATAKVFSRWIERAGGSTCWCASIAEFKSKMESPSGWLQSPDQAPQVVLCDLVLPDGDGMDVLSYWRKSFPQNPVVVITAFASVDNAVECLRRGAFDFLRKPAQKEELLIALSRAIEHAEILLENESLSSAVRVLHMAQTLSSIQDKIHLLRTVGRLLHREFQSLECFVFLYLANRNNLDCHMDARIPGLPRRPPEIVASEFLYQLIEKRPPPPENLNILEFRQNVNPKKTEYATSNCQIFELASPTGNCAYLVFFFKDLKTHSSRLQQFYPVLVQAQRTFQNIDLAAALSFVDELTGLYNQRFLEVALNNEIARAQRYNYPVSLLFIDLDRFKSVNDTFGHIVGSAVLKAASRLLKTCTRNVDQVLRYGGDEFVAILPNTNEEGALLVAERIRASFDQSRFNVAEETQIPSAHSLHCTTSIGLASYPLATHDPRELVQLADNAMYESKRAGKNRVSCANPEQLRTQGSHREGKAGKASGD
jgi:two-component system cell cycle response regulator